MRTLHLAIGAAGLPVCACKIAAGATTDSLQRLLTRLSLFLAFGTASLMVAGELWSQIRGART